MIDLEQISPPLAAVPARPATPPPGYYVALDGSLHKEPDMSTESRFGPGEKSAAPAGLAAPVLYESAPRRREFNLVPALAIALVVVVAAIVVGLVA